MKGTNHNSKIDSIRAKIKKKGLSLTRKQQERDKKQGHLDILEELKEYLNQEHNLEFQNKKIEINRITEAFNYFYESGKFKQAEQVPSSLIDLIFYYDSCYAYSDFLYWAEKIGIKFSQEIEEPELPTHAYAKVCKGLGQISRMKNDWKRAIHYYQQGVKKAVTLHLKSDCHSGLADVYRLVGNDDLALTHANKALECICDNDNNNLKAQVFERKGLVYVGSHQYESAIECYQNALTIRENLSSSLKYAQTLSYLSYAYINKVLNKDKDKEQDLKLALNLSNSAYDIYNKYGDKHGIARLDGDLAVLYNLQKEYDEAISRSELARANNKDIGYSRAATLNFIRLTHSLVQRGKKEDLEQAVEYAKLAINGMNRGLITQFDCRISGYFKKDLIKLSNHVGNRILIV